MVNWENIFFGGLIILVAIIIIGFGLLMIFDIPYFLYVALGILFVIILLAVCGMLYIGAKLMWSGIKGELY
jgi:hypothetical protein